MCERFEFRIKRGRQGEMRIRSWILRNYGYSWMFVDMNRIDKYDRCV